MALFKTENVEKMIEANRLKPEARTGLVIDTEEGVKEVILSGQNGKPSKRPSHRHNWWPEDKKLEVATLYAAIGNISKVAKLTKVPKNTIERWSDEEWFLQVQAKVRKEESLLTDRKLSGIVEKTLSKLEERVEEGDYIFDFKRGTLVNIPMTGRDLATVGGIVFDKRQLLRGEATKITAAVNSEEHLKMLAKKFEDYVKSKTEKVVAEIPEIADGRE